jgi:hypothetical protein
LTGYVRQSAADIVPTAVVRAAPINNEYNALRDAFEQTAGHKHDGTAAEGHYVPLIADSDARNKVAVDTTNNRVGVFVEVSAAAVEQVRVQDGAILPVTTNDVDLGSSTRKFKDLHIAGDLSASGGSATFNNVTINGTIDVTNTVISNVATPSLDTDGANKAYVDSAISALIDSSPGTLDTLNEIAAALNDDPNFAATMTTQLATKLDKSGGTMTGVIAMGGNKISGLGTPTTGSDAVTKTYVDTTFASTDSAATSAAEAAASAAAAAASYDSFDDRYLGPKSSAPSVDNDGNTLLEGTFYWNSTSKSMFVWNATAWVQATLSSDGFLVDADIGTTVQAYDADLTTLGAGGSGARSFLGLVIGTDVQAYDADLTTWAGKTAPTGTVVGTSDTQTLTNKTIEAGTFTNGYTEETVTANTSTAYTIDLANGTVQILTLTGNCTFTFPTAAAGKSFIMLLKQDGTGSRTVTWPAAVKWPGGTAPTITATASKLDKYIFTSDGTNWYGSDAGKNYTV